MPEWNSVKVVATSPLLPHTASATTLTASANGAFPTQDGVPLAPNDDLLVAGETAAPERQGLYTLTQLGDAGNPWVLTRRADADQAGDFEPGKTVYVREGAAHGRETWQFVNPTTPTTLGVTVLNFEGPGEEDVLSSYIEGLALRYVDANTVGLSPGRAYVPGLDKVLTVSGSSTATKISGNNALYYAYLEEYPAGSDLGRLRLITTAPSSPYLGSARTQSDDTTTRYLGMLRNDGSGNLLTFETEEHGSSVLVLYSREHSSTDLRALNAVSAATNVLTRQIGPGNTDVGGRLVSPCSRVAILTVSKSGASIAYLGWPTDPVTARQAFEMPAAESYMYTPALRLGPNQELNYNAPTGLPTLTVYVAGYYDRR